MQRPLEDEGAERPTPVAPKFANFKSQPLSAQQQVKKNVPQFKSFTPATTAVRAAGSRDSEYSSERRRRNPSTERKHDRHGSSTQGRKHRRDRIHDERSDSESKRDWKSRHEKARSRSRSPARRQTDRITLTTSQDPTILAWDTPDQPYRIDLRGDPHNLIYGTIHRYSIPKYYRYGKDRIVGLGRSARVESDKGDGKGLVIGLSAGRKENHRPRGWDYATEGSKLLKVKTETGGLGIGFAEGWNYLEIGDKASYSKRKRLDSENDTLDRTHPQDYRSIEALQKPKLEEEMESDLEYVSSSDDGDSAIDASVKAKTIQLTRRVNSEPHDIDGWFALTQHQDLIVFGSKERRRRKVKQGERQALEDVKLGILEQAIVKNKGNVRLLLEYMKIGARVWEQPKLRMKWEDVITNNPLLIELWTGYVNFRQSDFASFKYQDCLKVYEQCLEKLKSQTLRYGLSDEEKLKLETILLYLTIRATVLMAQAGFHELGNAIWQSLLEIHSSPPKALISAPDNLSKHEEFVTSFEQFWDSEVVRIGEGKSQGWAALIDRDLGEFPDPKELPDEQREIAKLDPNDRDFFALWLEQENERSFGLPARTTDEIEEDDPFRVILYTDVKSFIYRFQTPKIKQLIGHAFLAYAGLPFTTPYQDDVFLRSDLVGLGGRNLQKWFWPETSHEVKLISWVGGAPMEPERRGRSSRNPFIFASPDVPASPETMFLAPTVWFAAIGSVPQKDKTLDFKLAMLKDYVLRLNDEELALLYFAIEWKRNPEQNKKIAKILLRKYSQSIHLWNAYAMTEMSQGNKSAAEAVYTTALRMSTTFPETLQNDTIELWKSWIWAELTEGNEDSALNLFWSISEGQFVMRDSSTASPANILKARRYLEDGQQRMLSEQHLDVALVYTELLSLLIYLQLVEKDSNLYLKPLNDFMANLQSTKTTMLEKTYMTMARLSYHHATHVKPYRSAAFRSLLTKAISAYPGNTAFLSLFSWNESRVKIENRLRTLLQDVVLQEGAETVVKWTFSVWIEMHINANRNMNSSAVRRIFERAVENERTMFSIQLWVLYIQFELNEKNPIKAREVFFRSIRACPWSKEILLFGFQHLQSVLTFAEMRKVYAIMHEKELRLHIDVNEILEEWDQETGKRSSVPGNILPVRIILPDDDDDDA